MIVSHLNLVPFVVSKYCRRFFHVCEIDDLISVGNIGLIKAADRFEEGRDIAFSTYACHMIYGEIRRHIRDNTDLVSCPRATKDLYNKICNLQMLTFPVDQICAALEAKEVHVMRALQYGSAKYARSMEDVTYQNKDGTVFKLEDMLSVTDIFDYNLLIADVLSLMTDRDRTIFTLYYMNGLSQSEVGEQVGLSQVQTGRYINRIKSLVTDYLTSQQQVC